MKLSEFDYDLPPESIAQHPRPIRDQSRLLKLGRFNETLAHHTIRNLHRLIPKDSILVVNNTKVIPARLHARRMTGGLVELLFAEKIETISQQPLTIEEWVCVVRSSKHLKEGEILQIESCSDSNTAAP